MTREDYYNQTGEQIILTSLDFSGATGQRQSLVLRGDDGRSYTLSRCTCGKLWVASLDKLFCPECCEKPAKTDGKRASGYSPKAVKLYKASKERFKKRK